MNIMTDFILRYKKALIAAGFIIIFILQASSIASKKSNTWDEPAHILAGYAYLSGGMDYLSPLNHPVLGRALTAALPYAFLKLGFNEAVKPEGPPASDFFPYSLKFLYENRTDGDTVLFLARLSNILLGALLGIYIFIWSDELWGVFGATFSLFFYALSPNILAHSSLATTDMPVTVFFFITAYHLFKAARLGPGVKHIALASVFFAAALASKHTALLLLPFIAVVFISNIRDTGFKKTVPYMLMFAFLTYVLLWATYGFRFHSANAGYQGLDWDRFASSSLFPFFEALKDMRFLPESYLFGLAGAAIDAGFGRPAFLMGEYSATGWWYYFPIAFIIKTPIPTLIMLSASLLYLTAEKEGRKSALYLVMPAALVFLVFSFQKVNIGLRHILPAYPFIFTLIGFAPGIRTGSAKLARFVFYGSIVWYAYGAALIHPNQLAYFNEFIGGPKNGYRYLVDSNLDWGQDLKGLKEYMERRGIKKIKLAYFGFSDPKYFGIDYEYMPGYLIPEPVNVIEEIPLEGYFAISATMLQGVYLPDRDFYAIFRDIEPVGNIGYSIFIYRL